MKGGRYIGSGSDGCVFNTRFDAAGMAIPESKDGGQGIASKVYVSGPQRGLNTQAVNEYAIMMRARRATNGLGVAVALDGSLRSIPDIDPAERASITPSAGGACAQLTEATKPYTVIELPLVKGHMYPLPGGYSEASFERLDSAIKAIQAAKVTQLDLAVRNIFYDEDESGETILLLGDFGNGVDLESEDPEVLIKGFIRFVKHYKAFPSTLSFRDGVHYRGYLYMIASVFCFVARSKPEDQRRAYWKSILDMFASFKGSFRVGIEAWRLMVMINNVAPKPITLSDINSAELDAAFAALGEVPDVPPSVPPSAAPSAPDSGEVGGEIPIGFEDINDDEYAAVRDQFITLWLDGIEKTCDEIIALGEDPNAIFPGLVGKTRGEVLRSDELMYEFLRAMFVMGPVKVRLERLIAAWFPAPAPVAEGAARRRRTYRRKPAKRVKMSRRGKWATRTV